MHFAKTVSIGARLVNLLRNFALILPMFALVATCSDARNPGTSKRERASESVNTQKILTFSRPPIITAMDPAGVETARTLVSRLTPEKLLDRKGARFVAASELPWLGSSPLGRAYLASGPNRILVRGQPQNSCPIAFRDSSDRKTPIAEVARRVLTRCLDSAPKGCGCRIVAMGNALFTKREEITYATGVSARIRSKSLNLDELLVAEETDNGEILLRDLSGVIGSVEVQNDQIAIVRLKGETAVFTGSVRNVGFRRGRLARRIYAATASGERLSLLIGFDPAELAEFAGGWLAWPPDA